MANPIEGLNLYTFLKIVSKGAVYNNLSEEAAIWEMVKKKKKGPQEGRELRYLLRSSYGAAAAGFVPLDGGAYPDAQQSSLTEGRAYYKDFALTVEVERTLISKAVSDFSRYGEPLAEELRAKTIAMSRILSGAAYRDGTGVIGTVASIAFPDPNTATVTLDTASSARGHVGWFEYGDSVRFADTDAANPDAGWIVSSRDRENDQVTLTKTGHGSPALTGFLIYRTQQVSTPVLNPAPTADYNTLSEEYVGLESLAANDGRLVNGITMSGALSGTRRNVGGNPIDSQDFQQLMSQVMIAVGSGRYKYSKACMAWETLDALIESREVDRRFNDIKDDKRGVSQLGYVHGKNTLIFEADEFCPKKRIYVLPEGDVVQYHGSDFDFVKPEGSQKFFLKPNNGGHERVIRSYMEGEGCLLSVHSGAIGVLENFTA